MPRTAREKSSSETYHVMLRGINQQQIFEDDEDHKKFIEILKDYKTICEYNIYAYCLMGNHIHLVIKIGKEPIEQVFKRIGSKYVYWYNVKYQRTGHLFQDRFKSEPIEDDAYFLSAIRYVHQNPIKAGICKKPEEYFYSSYREYVEKPSIVDTKYTFELMSEQLFFEYNNTRNSDQFMDVTEKERVRTTDEEAKRIIQQYSKCNNIAEFQNLNLKTRDKYLKKFKEKGISIRQISRLTGVSYYIVQKI